MKLGLCQKHPPPLLGSFVICLTFCQYSSKYNAQQQEEHKEERRLTWVYRNKKIPDTYKRK